MNRHPNPKQRTPEALAKIQARTSAFQANKRMQNQHANPNNAAPQPLFPPSTLRQVIRLKDVEVQTVLSLMDLHSSQDPRQLAIEEDEKINKQKAAERNYYTLKAKQQQLLQKKAVQRKKQIENALKLKAMPEPVPSDWKTWKINKMRPATITKPDARELPKPFNLGSAPIHFGALFGSDTTHNEKPPTPGKTSHRDTQDSSAEDELLKDT